MTDLGNDEDIVAMRVHVAERKLLLASTSGRGFVVAEDQVIAQTKSGKQVLNLGAGEEAAVAAPVVGEQVAVVGENRKLVIFALSEVPVMTRGRGVLLQRYKEGGLSDVKVFHLADGLTWQQAGGRTRTEADLLAWQGKRGNAGRLAPKGFPRSNKFG